eukprot:TRINITY_DN6284_c0_g1_i2.p1 TRINITY_DN6284_c0_g1~~TRINITY_DN6284_c0_g1_i2.p1  ORF type:complete len:311 (-),score=106.67 TRINITY_DN6284_c0_g1_i2:104-1036(-)
MKDTARTRNLARMGIPPEARGAVWACAIGNHLKLDEESFERLAIHSAMVHQKHSNGAALSKAEAVHITNAEVIDADLPRTFGSLHLFDESGGCNSDLRKVLVAMDLLLPDVGYVQGMSYFAAMLSLYMEPLTAFIALSNLVDRHFFRALFLMDIDQIWRYLKIFDALLESNNREVAAHFAQLGLTSDLYMIDWLFTLYSKTTPLPVAGRIWDYFLVMGEVALFDVALRLLRYFKPQLSGASFEESLRVLNTIPAELQPDTLFSSAFAVKIPKRVHDLFQQELRSHEAALQSVRDDTEPHSGRAAPSGHLQ